MKKNKSINEKNYKRLITWLSIGIALIAFIIFVIYNSDGGHILKSEYKMNEEGYLDKIEVKLTKANYINNNTGIEVTFEITNKTKNTITITADDNFRFYDLNEVQIPNKFTSNPKIVKRKETIIYKLHYDVTTKELYEIYFYSGVVENNIKFSFKSSEINPEVVTEKNIEAEKKIED